MYMAFGQKNTIEQIRPDLQTQSHDYPKHQRGRRSAHVKSFSPQSGDPI